MKEYKFKINGNAYNVHIRSMEDNVVTIEVNGSEYHVELEKEKVKLQTPKIVRPVTSSQPAQPAPMKASGKLNKVASPLPGTIMHIKAKEGETVAKGAVLMIMEAMKMENNITAEVDGVVKSIKVKEGQAVLQGEVLAEIE